MFVSSLTLFLWLFSIHNSQDTSFLFLIIDISKMHIVKYIVYSYTTYIFTESQIKLNAVPTLPGVFFVCFF